jgi:hypothetical protein
MSKICRISLVALVVVVATQADAYAWPRRGYSYAPKQYTMPTMSTTQSMPTIQSYTSSGSNNSTAQGVAEMMAQRGTVAHFGGNSGYEGCGSGSTPDAAYRNCCFANSGMTTVDVGYAQGHNGQWFCCRRYR